ncbi:MAG: hypothetical protein QOE59_2394 [Actinomycetota bacterium]|nr:hypothetical protein [Actinomycetota bacterium]
MVSTDRRRRRAGRGGSIRAGRALTGAALGCAVLALGGGLAVAAPAPAPAPAPTPAAVPVGSRVLFVGDYETGTFGQWGTCQSAVTNSSCASVGRGNRTMRIVSGADAHQGKYAAEFDLGPGDVPDFGGGERTEVRSDAAGALTHEGDERWYQWSMKFPTDFKNPTGVWFIVMQWHAGSGSPPLAINISDSGAVQIGGDGVMSAPKKTLGPVRRGQWVDYTLHVKFSRNARTGFVEGWENGRQTVPKTARATMTSSENYLKQGIYRDTGPKTSVVLDGLKVTAP